MDAKTIQLYERIGEIFKSRGIKALSMTALCENLSMSKRTLYKYFDDKHDLVAKMMSFHLDKTDQSMCGVAEVSENAIMQIVNIHHNIAGMLKTMRPTVIAEVKKFYPDAYKIYNDHKTRNMIDFTKANIERGQKEGLYRKELNLDIVARTYVGMTYNMFDNDLFPLENNSQNAIHKEVVLYHLYALTNESGRQYMKDENIFDNINSINN